MSQIKPLGKGESCEFCPQGTDCSNLYTALRLIEASQGQLDGESLQELSLAQVKEQLAAGGFNFPQGGDCQFAQDPVAIRDYINQCIAILNEKRQESQRDPSEGSA